MRPGDKPLRKQMRSIVESCTVRAAHAAGLPPETARALSNAAGRDFIDRYDPARFRNTTGREIARLMRERSVLIDQLADATGLSPATIVRLYTGEGAEDAEEREAAA